MRMEKEFKVSYRADDEHDAFIVLAIYPNKTGEPDTVKFAKCVQAAIDTFKKTWRELG